MCWKHEWAKAINNLNRAIMFVERARESMQKRLLRNDKNLRRLQQNKKYNYPGVLKPVQDRIQKNLRAIAECDQIISELKIMQNQLFVMVHFYGIKQPGGSQRVYQLMGKYDVKEALEKFEIGRAQDGT